MKARLLLFTIILLGISPFLKAQDTYYGLYTEIIAVTERLNVDDPTIGNIYVWNGFTQDEVDPYFGESAINWKAKMDTWNGGAIHTEEPLDLSMFYDGYLHFAMRVPESSTNDFRIGMKDASENAWVVRFNLGEEPYDFYRDNQWYQLSIPLMDFVPENDGGEEISDIGLMEAKILFYIVGSVDVSFDEIYFSSSDIPLDTLATSVKQNKRIEAVTCYPNPASDYIFIKGLKDKSNVKISDLSGRVLMNTELETNTKLDISSLQRSSYIISVKSKEQNYSSVFIKK